MSATQSWPKDRVLYHRLEQLVYCVEHNEWPSEATMKTLRGGGGDCASDFGDSPSQRSSPASTPKHTATPGPNDFPDNFIDERISPKVSHSGMIRILFRRILCVVKYCVGQIESREFQKRLIFLSLWVYLVFSKEIH